MHEVITGDRDVPGGPRERVRLLLLVQVRNELPRLPGLFRSVRDEVDGVIALDDGSTDGSRRFLTEQPEVLELLMNPPNRSEWDEVGNHRRLVAAGLAHGAEWFLCLDADERIEVGFRKRAEAIIRDAELDGVTGFGVRLRELWDDGRRYRVDGIWGRKAVPRLFKAMRDHEFDERRLHSSKAPMQARRNGPMPVADLNIYHLGMLRPTDRLRRRTRYETLDPECEFQPGIGYAYLTDESGLQLESIPPHRDYVG